MSCFFEQYTCCNQNYNRRCCCNNGWQTPRCGVPGPRGPQGPRGFNGTPGLNGTLYADVTVPTAVAAGAIVPISPVNQSVGSPFTVTANTINVPAGTFLVTFGMNASGATAAINEASLYINGVESTTQFVTAYTSTTEPYLTSKTVLLTFPTAGTLSMYNTGAADATFFSGYITITRLA